MIIRAAIFLSAIESNPKSFRSAKLARQTDFCAYFSANFSAYLESEQLLLPQIDGDREREQTMHKAHLHLNCEYLI